MSDTSPLLALRGIGKSFLGVRVLDGVHLDVLPGEVHAVVGENGAGKSTLMKIVSGVYVPDEGTVEFAGASRRFSGPRDAQQAGIGIVHQEFNFLPERTVAENVYLGHEPVRRGSSTARRCSAAPPSCWPRSGRVHCRPDPAWANSAWHGSRSSRSSRRSPSTRGCSSWTNPPRGGLSEEFRRFGRRAFEDVFLVGRIPYALLVLLAVAVPAVAVPAVLLTRSDFGQTLVAAGGNPRTAELSGVRVRHAKTTAFVLSGLAAAVAVRSSARCSVR